MQKNPKYLRFHVMLYSDNVSLLKLPKFMHNLFVTVVINLQYINTETFIRLMPSVSCYKG